jgi:formylglycine-generating enzyme required for sulfatase activity
LLIVLVGGAIGLSGQVENLLKLFLPPSQEPLPIGFTDLFEAVEGARTVNVGGTLFYDRVVLKRVDGEGRLPEDLRLEFALVPMTRSLGDPYPFYIMADKVTNEAFIEFAKQNQTLVGKGWQQYDAEDGQVIALENPKLPVMNVTVEEANHFAKWIHETGRLPSVREWQKASGLLDCHQVQGQAAGGKAIDCANHPEGPFLGEWEEGRQDEVAVGLDRPRKVGASPADVSPFGCRDMAGNGFELTSDAEHQGSDTAVPVSNPVFLRTHVKLCGRSYDKPTPLTYEELSSRPVPFFYLEPDDPDAAPDAWPLNRERDVGFRIIIPIPSQVSAT